jgi:hypothetical protein
MQCACIILFLACPVVRKFSTFFRKRHDFRKTILNTKCVFLILSTKFSENFNILRGSGRNMIKNIYWSSYKVSSDFNETSIFLRGLLKRLKCKLLRQFV